MARQRKLDETDRQIVEAIKAHQRAVGHGPRYQDIAARVGKNASTICRRIQHKLVPAGLVRHDRYKHGTLEVVTQ